MLVIVTYDIKDVSLRKKQLNKVHKTCRKYLYQIQYSVFYGELTKTQFNQFKKELNKIIDKNIDMISFFTAKNKNNINVEFIGPIPPIQNII